MIKRQIISAGDPSDVRQIKEWMNTVADHINRPQIKGDGTTTRVNNGVVSAFPNATFPGVVNVNFNRFYDAAIVTDTAQQIGTAIVDNSTEAAKEFIKVAFTDVTDTDVSNITVTYEDAPDPLPAVMPEKESWFRVADWTVPICIIPPTGADTTGQVRQYQGNGEYKWIAIAGTTLPAGSTTGQMLVASKDGAVSLSQDMEWQAVPEESEPITLPAGQEDDVIIYNSENEMEAQSPSDCSVVGYDGSSTAFQVFANDYEVMYRDNGALVVDELKTT